MRTLRAAQVCHPYGIRGTLQLSVGAGPRPARGRTLCAPAYVQKRRAGEGTRPYEMGESSGSAVGVDDLAARGRPLAACLIRLAFGQPPSPKGEGFEMASPCLPL